MTRGRIRSAIKEVEVEADESEVAILSEVVIPHLTNPCISLRWSLTAVSVST